MNYFFKNNILIISASFCFFYCLNLNSSSWISGLFSKKGNTQIPEDIFIPDAIYKTDSVADQKIIFLTKDFDAISQKIELETDSKNNLLINYFKDSKIEDKQINLKASQDMWQIWKSNNAGDIENRLKAISATYLVLHDLFSNEAKINKFLVSKDLIDTILRINKYSFNKISDQVKYFIAKIFFLKNIENINLLINFADKSQVINSSINSINKDLHDLENKLFDAFKKESDKLKKKLIKIEPLNLVNLTVSLAVLNNMKV